MPKPGGWVRFTNADGSIEERDTYTCAHCPRIVDFTPKIKPDGGYCYGCAKPICGACQAKRTCEPIERKIEEAMRRHEALRSYGLT